MVLKTIWLIQLSIQEMEPLPNGVFVSLHPAGGAALESPRAWAKVLIEHGARLKQTKAEVHR